MQNIDAHEHAAVLEGAFQDSGDFAVRGQLSRGADRLIESFVANLYTTRKQLASKEPDLLTLPHDRYCGSVRCRRQPRFVHLKIQALEALAASDEF